MQPYTWLDREPLNTPLIELPVVREDQLRVFMVAADALLADAGAALVRQPKAAPRAHVNGHAAAGANGSAASDGSFFKQVNRAALADLARWVPRLFPRAALQQTGADRVNSIDLGRDFEEDLSIHPDGVRDFGPRKGLSPCEVVIEFGGAPKIQDAALTLCEWLGRDPAAFGWNATHKSNGAGHRQTSAGPNGDATAFFDPWAEPKPPSFPIDALPDVLRAFAEDRARIIGADPCALAWAAISAASAALHGGIRLKMKKHDHWSVPPAIWVALIGPPSTMKSPVIEEAWEPLQRAQRIDLDHWRQQLAEWRALPKNERDPDEPKPKRRLVSHDGTMEALQDILGRQDRGIGVLRDELSGWLGSLEKYSGAKASGADRAFFLQAFNGGPNVIDRVARGTIAVDNLLVTICGGIQPDRLRQFSDLTDDGLWQRFVPILVAQRRAVWTSRPAPR